MQSSLMTISAEEDDTIRNERRRGTNVLVALCRLQPPTSSQRALSLSAPSGKFRRVKLGQPGPCGLKQRSRLGRGSKLSGPIEQLDRLTPLLAMNRGATFAERLVETACFNSAKESRKHSA